MDDFKRKIIGLHKFPKGESRLYENINQLCILLDCITAALSLYGDTDIAEPDDQAYCDLYCLHFDCVVKIPIFGPARAAIFEKQPLGYSIQIYETNRCDLDNLYSHSTVGLKASMEYVIKQFYIVFYEKYKHWITESFGTEAAKWPVAWDMARAVRNACAHSGKISTGRFVTCYGLDIDPKDQGKQLFGSKMSVGDLLPLTFLLEAELERLGCNEK